jgi:glycosyltransferase involved in cell wall biosynthesis
MENVQPLAEELVKTLEQLPQYDFEIIFIDNCSDDGTQDILRKICAKDKRIKAIFNAKNFPEGSGLHVLFQAKGDCIISIPADFQVPVELVPEMLVEWEKGATVVALIKNHAKHDKVSLFRKLYYCLAKLFSNQNTLPGFTGSGLYDRNFINICETVNDPLLSMRYMVVHYAASFTKLLYQEKPRRSGKSKHSYVSLINIAIMRFVRVSDVVPHYAIITGLILGLISFLISIYYLVRKLLDWYNFPVGIAPLVIGMFFLGSIQLIFIGIIGEYVLMINERQKNKPRVVEKERINFPKDPNKQECKNA